MYSKMGIYRSDGEYVQCKYEQYEKGIVDKIARYIYSMCSKISWIWIYINQVMSNYIINMNNTFLKDVFI